MPQEKKAESTLPEVFSITETSAKLGCSARTVRRLIAGRQIDHLRVGGRVLVTQAAIAAYIKKNTIPAVDGKSVVRELLG